MTDTAVEIVHQNIHQRQSTGQLVEPAPNTEQLEMAFQAALTAPDHHRLKPTRFVVITAEQRAAFGELLSQALADMGETDAVQLERVKQHPFRAPYGWSARHRGLRWAVVVAGRPPYELV